MFINPALFYSLIVAVVSLGATVIIVVIAYLPLIRWIYTTRKNEEQIRRTAREEADRIVRAANDQGTAIIGNAQNEAKKLVAGVTAFSSESRGLLDSKLREVADMAADELAKTSVHLLKEYEENLTATKDKSISTIHNISATIEAQANEEVKAMKTILEQETQSAGAELKSLMKEHYDLVDKELQEYKEIKIKKLDEQIYQALRFVSEIVLGRVMDLKGQEDLIISALDEAKREHELKV